MPRRRHKPAERIQIYLKPDSRRDNAVLKVWNKAGKVDRVQDVFRSIIFAGIRELLRTGELPPEVAEIKEVQAAFGGQVAGSRDGAPLAVHVPVPVPMPGFGFGGYAPHPGFAPPYPHAAAPYPHPAPPAGAADEDDDEREEAPARRERPATRSAAEPTTPSLPATILEIVENPVPAAPEAPAEPPRKPTAAGGGGLMNLMGPLR